jgi:ribonuclease R
VALDDGRVEVGIHIADVSHFVGRDTPVDVEAAARGTSVYLVDRTVPMLPPVLSNDVCSLNPDQEKFAVSLFVVLDGQGRVVERRYERTVIRCRHALSYEEAQEVLDGRGSVSPEVDAALRGLDDRARHLRAERRDRGALDLDVPEAKVVLDAEGAPIDIRRRERTESHRLIEDYMILANEVVARDMEAGDLSTMYRIHERPPPEKVEALIDTLSRFGLEVRRRKSLKPSDVQRLLDQVRGRDEEALVNGLILRSMSKARYHTENLGHFGLASGGYLHFTSPIRRYPDLVVHRVLTEVFVHGAREPYEDRDALALSAERCSARERAAEEAERASVALKKAEFMERHLGETFAARISGVAAFGFFVTLEDFFVEGLVHVSGLGDDFYHYHERDHALVGERRGQRFRLGDRVEVQVARVDKEARHVDFTIVRKRQGRSSGRKGGHASDAGSD